MLLAAGVALYASGMLDRFNPQNLVAHQRELHTHIATHPWLSRLIFIGILTLGMCTGLPGVLLIILAGGFAFGVADGTLCSSVALTLGSLILYLASRHAFAAGTRTPPAFVAKLHAGFERHPVSYTLFLRFVPVMPFGGVTIALAWLRTPLWLFLGATWLGGTTSLIFETSVGAGLGEVLAHDQRVGLNLFLHPQVLLPMGALAVLALLPLAIQRIGQWRGQRSPHE